VQVRGLNFNRPNTQPAGSNARLESSVVSAKVTVEAVDLLRIRFPVRSLTLAMGSSLLLSPSDTSFITVDVSDNDLLINGRVQNATSIAVEQPSDSAYSLLPSILEILLKEPWHKGLIALVIGAASGLIALSRLALRSGRKKRRH
jgi:hypothetical protein